MDTKRIILIVLYAVLAGLLFTPWVSLDLGLWAQSWSLIEFSMEASDLSSNITSLLGDAYTSTDAAEQFNRLILTFGILWLAGMAGIAISIICLVTNTNSWYTLGGIVMIIATIVTFVYCCIYSDYLSFTMWGVVTFVLSVILSLYSKIK